MLHVDLFETLHETWEQLCATFDVTTELPEMSSLFERYDLNAPASLLAEQVIANMICEIVEAVGRFSPWYKEPAKSFGLTMINSPSWQLTLLALEEWCVLIEQLSTAIEKNTVLLQAIHFVDELEEDKQLEQDLVVAYCQCSPPCSIRIERAMLQKTSIVCAVCEQVFRG